MLWLPDESCVKDLLVQELRLKTSQRVDLFLAFVLKVREIVLASLRSNRRTSTCKVSFEMEHRRLRL